MLTERLLMYYETLNFKRGYQIVGLKLLIPSTISYFTFLIISILLYINENPFLLPALFTTIIISLIFDRRIDAKLARASIQEYSTLKKSMAKYMKKYRANHMNIYHELAVQFEKESSQFKRKINLYPQLTLITAFLLYLFQILIQYDENTATSIIGTIILLAAVFLIANPFINFVVNTFFQTKYTKMIKLSRIMNELYFDELIRLNSAKSIELNTSQRVTLREKV